MADKNCSACNDLREYAPNFTTNGVTTAVCNSLKNNTGLNASNSPKHTNCDDMEDVLDCLIGNMESEIEAYDVCDWKDFMRKFIPNLYNTLKADFCGACGQWAQLNSQLAKINRLNCLVDYLFKGASFHVGEEPSDGSYVVPGDGVSYWERLDSSDQTSDIYLTYIGGGLGRGGGSLTFHSEDWTDPKEVTDIRGNTTKARKGNSVWKSTGDTVNGNELIYEIRLKLSEFPELKKIYGGLGAETNTGGMHCTIHVFEEGSWAFGQHGSCKSSDGSPSSDGFSSGHKVPSGWMYVQLRMSWIDSLILPDTANTKHTTRNVTPRYWIGMRFNQDKIDC